MHLQYDLIAMISRGSSFIIVLWDLIQTCLIHPSPHIFFGWRRFWYRLFGAQIGRGVLIRKSVRCNYPWKVVIGDFAWIGDEAWLYALDHITIGAHAVISQQVYICTGTHEITDPHFGLKIAPIIIGEGAWIALGALVMPGLTVGAGAVVGARSVLTHSAVPMGIYLGTPAKLVGTRLMNDAK